MLAWAALIAIYDIVYVYRYGEYMRKCGFRWAVVVLVEPHCRPTRQAEKVCACSFSRHSRYHALVYAGMQAVASLLPRFFVEFLRADTVSDWVQDRPGLDYGPRWHGDEGIRAEAAKKRAEDEAAAAADADPELDALMPSFEEKKTTGPPARIARRRAPLSSKP